MEAVILAGGKGTRLKPFTSVLPKPLVPVGDWPIIEILLRQFKKSSVTKVHIALNHLAHLIEGVLGDGSRLGLEIKYYHEDKPLSTVAPVKRIGNLPEHFIVANGDVLTDLDVSRLYEQHVQSGVGLTVAVTERTEKVDFGVLEISAGGFVEGFKEKPEFNFTVSMGVYVFSRNILEQVPDDKPYGFDDLMRDMLKRGEPVGNFPYSGYWLDIGRPTDYEKAQRDIGTIRKWLE